MGYSYSYFFLSQICLQHNSLLSENWAGLHNYLLPSCNTTDHIYIIPPFILSFSPRTDQLKGQREKDIVKMELFVLNLAIISSSVNQLTVAVNTLYTALILLGQHTAIQQRHKTWMLFPNFSGEVLRKKMAQHLT